MSVHDLQAPDRDGQILVHPPMGRIEQTLQLAQERLSAANPILAGMPLSDLRESARMETWERVQEYYRETGETLEGESSAAWFVGGHQPELFHPGVWLKNFFLADLARRFGGTSLNLIVDNDTARSPFLRLPGKGRILPIPFDHWPDETPYEERNVADESLFARFPQQAGEVTASWPFRPLLLDFWIDVQAAAKETRNVAERLVRARRAWERRWGIRPVELPVSRLCRTGAFAHFAVHIASNAAAFRDVYNNAVEGYRREYGLRSRNHPVPNLAIDGEWIELPFWGWRTGAPRRGRLFARVEAERLILRCDAHDWPALDAADLPASCTDLERNGFKVRPRALSLTLFTRLCLADLFVHGLGGGKYDEVTDRILVDFFGLAPPPYVVMTGTLRLPLELHPVTEDDRRRLAWRVRDLFFNPQRHIDPGTRLTPRDRELLMTKLVLMRYEPLRHRDRKDRFFQMRHLNEDLRPLVASRGESARHEISEIEKRLEENAVLSRRDYSFCLQPEGGLHAFVSQVSNHIA